MRSHTRLTFRQILFAALFLAVFTVLTIFLFTFRREERLFEKIADSLFREELSSNTLNLHYTLAVPADFGIRDYKAVLPCYSSDSQLAGQAQTENLISVLNAMDPQKLSEENAYTRALLLRSLENSLAMSSFPYYEEPLSPSSGMQSQLPILFAEYAFRCQRDVEDYLKLLDQTDEYFEALLLYEQEKAEAGLLMPSVSLKKVVEQCDTILTKEELDAGTHFLQSTFRERLDELKAEGEITEKEAQSYLAQNDRLLRTVMLPAYEKLGDGLLILEDPSITLSGLASRPVGSSYYEYLLFSETGSSRPVSEIKAMMVEQFDREYKSIRNLLTGNPSLAELACGGRLEEDFPWQTASQMLTDLQKRMEPDFPSLDQEEPLPSVAVKTVSASLQDYCAPAFYLTPPLDDTSSNAIYINEKTTPSGLELYTTLAHEGYPGHMYQSVYHNRTAMQGKRSSASNVRELLWFGGYLEGWALYVEFISYDYASSLYRELGENDLSEAVRLTKHDRSLQLCLYCLLDIMIHYENASYPEVQKLLNTYGITDETAVSAIYEYIAEEPANYLKYYLGYLEILSLKEQAKALWKDAYSDYAFHTFFLECGPAGFELLREQLQKREPAS